eukprot:TRINITY_DN10531_c0_g1_i8.p1 TRINITY_DN10531_c0_g1~~TRINITY_DN10531_c0_g1_i8.p1  ORF type:complete len:331 (+),score=68.06 TRINITY_DN10531_c0_g1_i8:207-1199(+)
MQRSADLQAGEPKDFTFLLDRVSGQGEDAASRASSALEPAGSDEGSISLMQDSSKDGEDSAEVAAAHPQLAGRPVDFSFLLGRAARPESPFKSSQPHQNASRIPRLPAGDDSPQTPQKAAPLAGSSRLLAEENGDASQPLTVSMKRRLQRKRSQALQQHLNAMTSCGTLGKRPRSQAEPSQACRAIPSPARAPAAVVLSLRDLLELPDSDTEKADARDPLLQLQHAAGGAARGADTDKSAPDMPEASEEDWQRRTAKRENAIDSTKSLPEYEVFCRLRGELVHASSDVPRTPDASDRSISKRRWEEDVRQWRSAIRKVADEAALPDFSTP